MEIDNKKAVDEQLIKDELYDKGVAAKTSARRKDIAKRRKKLGFDDKGAEEMDDPAIDKLEYTIKKHET
jgi:hypothetical protein